MTAEQEVARLRLMLREVATLNATGIDYALRCQRERDEARSAYASAAREWAERHEHARERILGLTRERDLAVDEINRLMTEATYAENARLTSLLAHAEAEAIHCRGEMAAALAEAEEAARAYNDVAADLRRTAAERDELAAQAVDRLMLVASLRSELATTKRELHRLIHGTAIEGDGACEHEIHADAARAWARLWHREARRLWREVQALSGVLDDELGARTAMLALAHARRQVLETGYGHDVLDVARRAVEAVADVMLREGTP